MKGKSNFTAEVADQIILLIEQKLKADSSKQKGIREKIRKLGFYASDFGLTNYDAADFRRVATIVGEHKLKNLESVAEKKPAIKVTSKPLKKETENLQLVSDNFSQTNIDELKNMGFKGFYPIKDIIQNYTLLPKEKGVYILLHTENPNFLEVGTGGFFKGKDPHVSIQVLEQNWITDSPIIYIGKAGSETGSATLQSRLKQYFNFGQGKAVGHWGGRYIWQLKNPYNILVGWMETPDNDPRIVEAHLIKEFVKKYGKRPFANLVG